MLSKVKTAFVIAHAQYVAVYMGIAERLKADGCDVYLYVSNESQRKYYLKSRWGDLFLDIIVCDNLRRPLRPDEILKGRFLWDRTQELEADLGLTINELRISDRHYGRGFALGGFGHPRSRYSSYGYEAICNRFVAEYNFWRVEFAKKEPSLVINGSKVVAALCRSTSTEFRQLANARIKNFYYWGENEFQEIGSFEAVFNDTVEESQLQIDTAYDDHLVWRQSFLKGLTLWGAMKNAMHTVVRHVYWRVRRYEKAHGYFLFEEVRYALRKWRHYKKLKSMSVSLDSVRELKFVYYPLHVEPEVALTMLSPEQFDQLGVIVSISRDLPADTFLVVKETPGAVGRRPEQFYEQIYDLKNVFFVDLVEHGVDVIRASAGVCTISGTGGLEGALFGKPVVSFGVHNLYNVLPHVRYVGDLRELRMALNFCLTNGIKADTWVKNGRRFITALLSRSFRLNGFNSMSSRSVDQESLDLAYRRLLDGLEARKNGAWE